jgi:hypothetical protein
MLGFAPCYAQASQFILHEEFADGMIKTTALPVDFVAKKAAVKVFFGYKIMVTLITPFAPCVAHISHLQVGETRPL